MLKIKLTLIALSSIFLLGISSCTSRKQSQPSLIPYPNSIRHTGDIFRHKAIRLVDAPALDLAPFLKPLAQQISIVETGDAAMLKFAHKPEMPQDAYRLEVKRNDISIAAGSDNGYRYALVTLAQLLDQCGHSGLPSVEINDQPQYSWRGMHLDVCRHFFEVDFIKKMLDSMAKHKLNTFHWHLTDDQGWRIEIKKYPQLAEQGAWREETIKNHMANHPKTYDGMPYGGHYTQKEIKEVVQYAQARGITVIPEIEMPGHAVAAARVYPKLCCTGKPKPFNEWGVSDDVFCAGNEEVFHFLEQVIDEIIPLFPSPYIHIGGDECPKDKWKTCPQCQKRMTDEGLKDEMELQSYFVQRMEKYINSKGKKIIGWDEIMEGGLAENATVMSWRGIEGGLEAASEGHNVIICPNAEVYFDHYQSPYNEPTTIAGLTTMESVYHWSPMPDSLAPEFRHHVLGSQANLWTEYMINSQRVEYMAYPRLCALAEMLWTNDEQQNFQQFTTRMNHHYQRLDSMGLAYRIPYPDKLLPVEVITPEQPTLNLSVPIKNATVYYTTDSRSPKKHGKPSTRELQLHQQNEPLLLRCATQMPNGRWSAEHQVMVYFGTMPATALEVQEGAKYQLLEGEYSSANIDFDASEETSIQQGIHPHEQAPQHFYAEQLSGYISLPKSDVYTFKLTSDDGSLLYIGDREIINNDGFFYERTREGRVALEQGLHPFVIKHFQAKYGGSLRLQAKASDGTLLDFSKEGVFSPLN